MPQFIATSSKGLMDVLYQEVSDLGLNAKDKNPFGVRFDSNWKGCYEANLKLRSATRVLKPILDFHAYNNDDIYYNTKKHDFTKYISVEQKLMVDVSIADGSVFSQNQMALVIKDSIVDQFRDKFLTRPSVETKNPDLRVVVKVDKALVSLAVDTSGENLSQRGYRTEAAIAPLREHLAAGLLMMTGWKPSSLQTVVDPMCGSGTFLIEAALMTKSQSPRPKKRKYSFENFRDFDKKIFDDLLLKEASLREASKSASVPQFFGFDKDAQVILSAKENAKRAGVEDLINFEVKDFNQIKKWDQNGLVVINPPYGKRLGEVEELKSLYKSLGRCLKNNFGGWTCWILSGEKELTRELGLKTFKKIPVKNGSLECRFLGYNIRGFPEN